MRLVCTRSIAFRTAWLALTLTVGPALHASSTEDLFDLPLEALFDIEITTVSRVEEPLDEAPGTVYVFSRELIQNRGYRSLGELLRVVPGFTVFHRDLQYVVGVRGLNANDNDKVSLLVNGQRVLGLHEQEFLNGPINLDNVERVEVVVGPSSLFQQADTLAATINVITRNTTGAEAMLATGTDLPYSGTLLTGKQWAPDRFISFSVTLEEKDGFKAWRNPSRPFLPGQEVTGELEPLSYFSVLNGQAGEITAQAVAYRSAWPELHIEGADPANDGEMVEEYYSIHLKDEHSWNADVTSVIRFEAAQKEQTRLNAGGPPVNAAEVVSKQRLYRAEAGLQYTGLEHHLIQGGAQGSYEDNFDTYFTFLAPSQPGAIPRTTLVDDDVVAVGFYLDDTYEVSDHLKLIGGARIDRNKRLDGNRWFPGWRSAVVYHPTDGWVSKVVYNRAIRMPSPQQALNEVWGSNNPTDNPANPPWAQLSPTPDEPEELTTLELQNILYLGNARLGATLYRQDLKDFISWFQPGANGGDFSGTGLELSLQAPLDQRSIFWANAAWNDSELDLFRPEVFGVVSNSPEDFHAYVNEDDRIIGSAQYTANLGIDYEIVQDLTLSPSLRYFTEQAAVDFRTQEEGGPVLKTIRDRVYVDATLMWRNVAPMNGTQMDVRLSGYNLADNRDPVGAQIFGDTYRPRGISAVLSVALRF